MDNTLATKIAEGIDCLCRLYFDELQEPDMTIKSIIKNLIFKYIPILYLCSYQGISELDSEI